MRTPSLWKGLAAVPLAFALTACETETPTTVAVQNGYPAIADGADPTTQTVVYRVWYAGNLFTDPVAPGVTTPEERGVPSTDTVYALLAEGWDPASSDPPTKLIPIRSKGQLTVQRGNLGLIVVSSATFEGDCAAGSHLAQDEADFILQRIFPGPFADAAYDAKTCARIDAAVDGGASTD